MDSRNLSNITKSEKKNSILVTNFVELLLMKTWENDVLFREVLFSQQTCHFCLVKCGDLR